MHANCRRVLMIVAVNAGLVASVGAQQRPIKIQVSHLGDDVHMLTGAGGNLAACVADDGVLLIDSEYAQLTDKVLDAIKSVTDKPIRIVVNTHWHFDHVGGNERLAKEGALIIAHENVRQRMSVEQVLRGMGRRIPPSPEAALPDITFKDSLTFHWGEEEVRVIHIDPAHTDGDSIVHFRKANVLHLADVYFNGTYPFIDVNAGGSIDGMIKGVDAGLALADDKTKIIPGHGPLSNVAELREYRAMLVTVRDRVKSLREQGKSREDVIASKPTKDLDAKWAKSFAPDMWVGIVYDGMTDK